MHLRNLRAGGGGTSALPWTNAQDIGLMPVVLGSGAEYVFHSFRLLLCIGLPSQGKRST